MVGLRDSDPSLFSLVAKGTYNDSPEEEGDSILVPRRDFASSVCQPAQSYSANSLWPASSWAVRPSTCWCWCW